MEQKVTGIGLQFFAEGAPGEAPAAAPAGVNPAAAGQDTGVNPAAAGQTGTPSLEDLGVPADRAERYRAIKEKRGKTQPAASAAAEPSEPQQTQTQAAAAAEGTEGNSNGQETQTSSAPDWDELMKNPEMNKRMQETVRATVNSRLKPLQKNLQELEPVVRLIAEKYGMDTADMSKFDYSALSKKVLDDDYFFEDLSDRYGTDMETAKASYRREQELSRREQAVTAKEQQTQQGQGDGRENETIEELMVRNHVEKMHKDGERLKQMFPDFDLQKELKDRRFAAMVSPGGGMSVEDAYYAIHRREIENARMQQMQSAISRNLQSGGQIPKENGGRGQQSQPSGQKLYSQMTKEERAAYKKSLTGGSTYDSGSFVSGRR